MITIDNKTEQESKAWYQRAWDLLSEYKNKTYTATIFHGKRKEFTGIEVYAPSLTIDEKIDHIRSLLGGMSFTVSKSNSETISIK